MFVSVCFMYLKHHSILTVKQNKKRNERMEDLIPAYIFICYILLHITYTIKNFMFNFYANVN